MKSPQYAGKNAHIFGSTSYTSTVKPRSAKNRASIPGPAPKSKSAAPGGAILRTRSWNAERARRSDSREEICVTYSSPTRVLGLVDGSGYEVRDALMVNRVEICVAVTTPFPICY